MMLIRNEKLYTYLTSELYEKSFKGIALKDETYWYVIYDKGHIKYITTVDNPEVFNKGFSDTVKDFIKDINERSGKVTHPESFYLYHILQTKGNIKKRINKTVSKPLPSVIRL